MNSPASLLGAILLISLGSVFAAIDAAVSTAVPANRAVCRWESLRRASHRAEE